MHQEEPKGGTEANQLLGVQMQALQAIHLSPHSDSVQILLIKVRGGSLIQGVWGQTNCLQAKLRHRKTGNCLAGQPNERLAATTRLTLPDQLHCHLNHHLEEYLASLLDHCLASPREENTVNPLEERMLKDNIVRTRLCIASFHLVLPRQVTVQDYLPLKFSMSRAMARMHGQKNPSSPQ